MAQSVLGVGEMAVTNEPGASIKTFALGSCVALIVLDPVHRAIGMAHIALPSSQTNPERAAENPGYFADTAVEHLLEKMQGLGCDGSAGALVVKLAGGASILDLHESFDIGKKNELAIKKHLWKRGLGPIAEDLGGNHSRTVELEVNTGRVILYSSAGERWEI